MLSKTVTPPCFHGGAAYRWIGDDFEGLSNVGKKIDADVLDAWFDPSPKAIEILTERLAWSLRCSPPVVPRGVIRALAQAIDVSEANLVCGAGSSALIFLALREFLSASSRVLILDPTYGEYAHVVSTVIGCKFDSFELRPDENYVVDLSLLVDKVTANKYDLVIVVNPNNPSGQLIERQKLEAAIEAMPADTLVWIDEAYIDYAGRENSLEQFATMQTNVIVCKSLSKVFALSGLRAAYLVSNRKLISHLSSITPPWSLSLPAQLVLTEALKDQEYYDECYRQTHRLREHLSMDLTAIGFSVLSSTANFLLVHYSKTLPKVEDLLARCSEQHLLLRNVRSMGKMTSDHSFRIAVKDAITNKRAAEILRKVTES